MRGLLLVLSLIAVPLAGCLEAETVVTQEIDPRAPVLLSHSAQEAEAVVDADSVAEVPTEPRRSDWFRLPLQATEEGGIAAYTFTVPEGAAFTPWYDGDPYPVLEVAFLEDAAIEAWGLVVVDTGSGRVVTVHSGFPAEAYGFGAGAATPAGSRSLGTGVAPFYVDLDGVTDGSQIGIAVAARGTGIADVGIRFLTETPWQDDGYVWPSEDAAEFLERAGETAWLPYESGTGTGFSLDMFYDNEDLIIFPYAARIIVGDVDVQEAVPDSGHQPANDLMVHIEGGEGAGFTSLLAWSWTSMQTGAVEWSLQGRDAPEVAGVGVITPEAFVDSHVAASTGDGEGPSVGHLRLTHAGAYGVFGKLTILDHFAFDVPLEALFGTPVEDAVSGPPLPAAPASPQEWLDHGRLVLPGAHGPRVLHVPQ